ncbi:MAG: RsmD family RNA methyltransferase [Bifidobacteriaceae bacterium]|jgi:16S rRNA (guanine966-N2)-methyltransferase|nr:RsmD family RNA methyltransferase [Bifidobacteriaceae bacterium]
MTRIVAGSAGGRTIKVPAGGARPTTERVREAIFSLLEARMGGPGGWAGRAVLDLYAGSGALALEALSRGAASAVAVDSAPAAARAIKANAAALGLAARLTVRVARAEALVVDGAALAGRDGIGQVGGPPFDVAFLDPPYDAPTSAPDAVLAALARPRLGSAGARAWLADAALVVLERSARTAAPTWPAGWDDIGVRKYGETAVYLARAGGGPTRAEGGLGDGAGRRPDGGAAAGGRRGRG